MTLHARIDCAEETWNQEYKLIGKWDSNVVGITNNIYLSNFALVGGEGNGLVGTD